MDFTQQPFTSIPQGRRNTSMRTNCVSNFTYQKAKSTGYLLHCRDTVTDFALGYGFFLSIAEKYSPSKLDASLLTLFGTKGFAHNGTA